MQPMTENQFHLVRAAGFLLAVAVAATLQHWSPHRRLTGSRRVNLGLWAVNLLVIGSVCGACACTVARWAAANGVGLLNVISMPFWVSAVTTILALDFSLAPPFHFRAARAYVALPRWPTNILSRGRQGDGRCRAQDRRARTPTSGLLRCFEMGGGGWIESEREGRNPASAGYDGNGASRDSRFAGMTDAKIFARRQDSNRF